MMITAVDTNIILDIVKNDKRYLAGSKKLLTDSFNQGALIISEIVYSELAAAFQARDALEFLLKKINIKVVPLSLEGYYLAGQLARQYYNRKKRSSRHRILADFIIGVHSLLKADRLLTRDRGFYKDYFKELVVI